LKRTRWNNGVQAETPVRASAGTAPPAPMMAEQKHKIKQPVAPAGAAYSSLPIQCGTSMEEL